MIDYRKFMIRYMAGVMLCEGVFFDPIDMSDEERTEWEQLQEEAETALDEWRESNK